MTVWCRLILVIACLTLLLVVLFPPRREMGGTERLSRGFLFSKHLYQADYEEWGHETDGDGTTSWNTSFTKAEVATDQMLAEIVGVAVTGVMFVVMLWRPDHRRPRFTGDVRGGE